MKRMKTIFAVCLVLTLLFSFTGCKQAQSGEATKLSFQAASGYDYLKTLDGKQVTISGYMATSSPVDGSFMFLMNLPYQSCPFCVPNTSQLSNTMEVYPKKGESFGFTNQAIKIVGTLKVAESEDKPFTDMYGYEFNYKIVDATYTIIQADELSEDMALWQKIAETDVVSDIYRMYDYVNFLCAWNTYYVNSGTDENGNVVPGYYLYPTHTAFLPVAVVFFDFRRVLKLLPVIKSYKLQYLIFLMTFCRTVAAARGNTVQRAKIMKNFFRKYLIGCSPESILPVG